MIIACHSGPPAKAEVDLARIRAHGRPWADSIKVKEYSAQQSMLDACPEQSDSIRSATNQIVLFHLAGELNTHPSDDGAVGNRDAAHACIIQASWPSLDPAGSDSRSWARSAWTAIRPHSTGGNYVNFQTEDEGDERTHAAYGDNYPRLRAIKAKYDPSNLFRVNRNIPPSTRLPGGSHPLS